jgi:hypothetical protein
MECTEVEFRRLLAKPELHVCGGHDDHGLGRVE